MSATRVAGVGTAPGSASRRISRRAALAGIGAGSLGLAGCAALGDYADGGRAQGRVVVVGGGFGGATAARALKRWGGPGLQVMLIEREPAFVSCPLSNLVLSGDLTLDALTLRYDAMRREGVVHVQDEVLRIDVQRRRLTLGKLADQTFDRLVVAPGVDFRFDEIRGYGEAARARVLHAFKAGPQTLALRRQLEAMRDGGVFVMTVPRAPYRCPPGPYERACLVASWLRRARPRAKLIVLDANPEIQSKKALFARVFDEQYRGIIDYRPNFEVTEIDAASLTVMTELGERVRGDVLNVVPPQGAGAIARQAGLVDVNDRWCGVDWITMESTAAPGVHVVGDAVFAAAAMPKSGHMANQHGKVAAGAIVELLSGRTPAPPTMNNTCYSFVDATDAMHVASVHRYDAAKKTMLPVPGAGGLSMAPNVLEGGYAHSWARNIWAEMLG